MSNNAEKRVEQFDPMTVQENANKCLVKIELKSCPFCGSKDIEAVAVPPVEGLRNWSGYAFCRKCFSRGKFLEFMSGSREFVLLAVKNSWNTRKD